MKFEPVKLLQVHLNVQDKHYKLGRLALKDRQLFFEYDSAFLPTKLEVSPFRQARHGCISLSARLLSSST